jgi:hypothetical protein
MWEVNGKENLGKMGLKMPLVGLGQNDFDFSLFCKHLPRFDFFFMKKILSLNLLIVPFATWE